MEPAHPTALTGHIKLDEAGKPVWIGVPDALLRSGNQSTC
jgi:hypothetical protein